MVGIAKSELLKAGIKSAKVDHAKKEAAERYRLECLKPRGERLSAAAIAAEYGPEVTATTVWRLSKEGTQTIADANRNNKSHMRSGCRALLHDWLLEMADRALPVTRKLLIEKANSIIRATDNPDHDTVSDAWVDRFYASPLCHDLSTHWSSELTKDRARAVNPNTVRSWLEMIKREVVDKGIQPENQYGFDESNFIMGQARKVRVTGRRGAKNTYSQQGGSRQSVTVMVTICADGSALTPTAIFKGTKLLKRWGDVNPLEIK